MLRFSKMDVWAILRGAAIASAGALLTYLTAHLADFDLGQYGPIASAILAVAVNAFRLFVRESPTTKSEE